MLRSAAVTIIRRKLGFRTDLEDEIVSALQQAQRLFEKGRTLPWFLRQEDQTLTITSGSGEISLPTGFIRECEDEGPHYTDTDTNAVTFLEKISLNVGLATFADADDGKPLAYTLRNTTIKVYPDRDTSYTAYWSYFEAADVLTSDIENAWLQYAPDALIGRAGMLIAEDLPNKEAHGAFSQMYSEGWSAAFAETILREESNRKMTVGGRL